MQAMKKLLSLIIILAFVLALIPEGILSAPVSAAEAGGIMRDITTMELVYDMGMAINLGNTFDSSGDWIGSASQQETAWGSPVITEAIIRAYAEAGFRTIRIPVTWSNAWTNMSSPDYIIPNELLDRVQQVVDWVIDNGMYAIVNMHHDDFYHKIPNNVEEGIKKYTAIWGQISERFKDYSDYLMLESQNEPNFDGTYDRYSWNRTQKQEALGLLNRLNQSFVNVVRASGSNNSKRHLLISTYWTNIDIATDPDGFFKMPDDPAGRLAVSVHYYEPWNWVGMTKDESWGNAQWTWGSDEDYRFLRGQLDKMKVNYADKGYPVIIGEFLMLSDKGKELCDLWEREVARESYERGFCPVLWEVQLSDQEISSGKARGIFNRRTLTWWNPEVLAGLMEIQATRDFTKADENWIAVSEPIETLNYHLNISNMPVNPTLTFENQNPNWSDGKQNITSWENGQYSITYTYSGTGMAGLKNLGWVHNITGSPITMTVDKITMTYGSGASAGTVELTSTPLRTLEVGTNANGLPNIWSGIGVGQKLYENSDGTSWLAYDGNTGGGTDNICLYVNGTRTNIRSIKYDFTLAGGIEVKEVDLTVTVNSLNPDITYAIPFKGSNGAYNYNVDFETKVAGLQNLGSANASMEDTDIKLSVNKLIVNGKYDLKPTKQYVMETKTGGSNGMPDIWTATEGEKLFQSTNGMAWLALENGIIKLFVMVPPPNFEYAEAFATVEKLKGNQNELTITITEYFSDGSSKSADYKILIDNNAAGIYEVGGYKVFVDTKGNTQIRNIYIVK